MVVRFDDSLLVLAKVIADQLGEAALSAGVVLRDATGRLTFFLPTEIDNLVLEELSARIHSALGHYARTDRVIAGPTDFGAYEILHDQMLLHIPVEKYKIRLIDRRLAGADWLRAPAPAAAPPPRFVFASLKGGVGRSTALSIAAADIASRGRRVLAVDLDMEAPGLGAMLLDDNTLPEFGLIDALVENGISGLDDAFLADLIGPSSLAEGHGRIDVIPAFGRRSLHNPGEVLAKIARAYMEDISSDGSIASILDQVRSLVDHFANADRYEAILVDARAGLHETTAAAILGLGADVFLFGLDEPQTFQGYSALLAHLARFVCPGEAAPEWIERLTMVQGRALDAGSLASFAEKCQTLFTRSGLCPSGAASSLVPLPAEPFGNVPWDDNARDEDLSLDEHTKPRDPIAIIDDERFRLFQPMRRRDLLSREVYRSSFGALIDRINEALPGDNEDVR